MDQKSAQSNPQPAPKPSKPNNITVREIDATDQVLGRLATQVAIILRGKDKPQFVPNLVMGDKVVITNAAKIVLTGNKLETKKYYKHTGYLGNLKETSAKDLMRTNPAKIIEKAIYGMLPSNKLRKIWMKNLTIKNGE